MKLITRRTDYAIRVLGCMAKDKNQIATVAVLAKNLAMPQSFLRKILQELNKAGVLKSYKGRGGGFSLNIAPSKISVFDIMQVFQGSFKLNEHVFQGKICPVIKVCYFKQRLDKIESTIKNQLKSITIQKITHSDSKKKGYAHAKSFIR